MKPQSDMSADLDLSFDFRSDTPSGKDPDSYSPTLRRYHKHLWSKPLPNGEIFFLDDSKPGAYLYHHSELGEFFLSSDSVIHSFSQWKSMAHIISQIAESEIEAFRRLGYTIGGMIIFPGNRIGGKSTINGARGLHHLIRDRIDLTLECIRRHYLSQESPLSDVIGRYADFFSLFDNFRGYVEFFYLQDLVNEDFSDIRFFSPFHDFKTPAVPNSIDSYRTYKAKSMQFVELRNQRILASLA